MGRNDPKSTSPPLRSPHLRLVAALIAGVLIGATTTALRLGGNVERLTLDNAILIDEVERLAGMLESRERALALQRRAPVDAVEVEVANLSQEHVRLHIEQRAHELLRHLVGEESDQLNASLIESALNRTVVVDKTEYTMAPTLILLGRKVYVRLEAHPGRTEGEI